MRETVWRQAQDVKWALAALGKLPKTAYNVGAPHHKTTCEPDCRAKSCRPTIKVGKATAARLGTFERVAGGNALLLGAARGCHKSMAALEELVKGVAFQ